MSLLAKHEPIIIFAQSGRFLAQSAASAGYTVWVADCFGDKDTLSIADRWQKIPDINHHDRCFNILSTLANNEPCTLICGSGIEGCYQMLNKLPSHIKLIGNKAPVIKLFKRPRLFFKLLDKLNIAYPNTQFTHPNNTQNWLAKKAAGWGGKHITHLTPNFKGSDYYFQSYIAGRGGACLFLANGNQANIMSINKQVPLAKSDNPFCLSAIHAPWFLSKQHVCQLKQMISAITVNTHLVGLNSIDFIISEDGQLLILEVNPRPSASAELIQSAAPLLQHHINACQGSLPKHGFRVPDKTSSLYYIFAKTALIIPTNMVWPADCHDLPKAGTIIKKNEPICTAVIHHHSNLTYDEIVGIINKQCMPQ